MFFLSINIPNNYHINYNNFSLNAFGFDENVRRNGKNELHNVCDNTYRKSYKIE